MTDAEVFSLYDRNEARRIQGLPPVMTRDKVPVGFHVYKNVDGEPKVTHTNLTQDEAERIAKETGGAVVQVRLATGLSDGIQVRSA